MTIDLSIINWLLVVAKPREFLSFCLGAKFIDLLHISPRFFKYLLSFIYLSQNQTLGLFVQLHLYIEICN